MNENSMKTMFSSNTDNWSTPQEFFDELNREFHFDLDSCADDTNHKCETYYTRKDDGLIQNWGGVAYSAIPHMVEKSRNGLRKRLTKAEKKTLLLSC